VAIKRAKTLDDEQFDRLLKFIDENSTMPVRDRLMFLLSFKAGLRVSEIAKIDLKAMTNAEGKIAKIITIFSNVGKKQKMREIPMHPTSREALAKFMKTYPQATFFAFSSQPFRYLAKHGPGATTSAHVGQFAHRLLPLDV
jgi:site-specific recombinase XerC